MAKKKAGDDFPVVGLGASAGGLEAVRALLNALPPETGMAFVLVQHMDPTHESLLSKLLEPNTQMPVRNVTDGMKVEPNHVYVMPPNTSMTIARRVLRLLARPKGSARHTPIDRFFNALAEDQPNNAIGVVFSGLGSDGTLGLKAIKAAGGLTFAQDERSAKYSGMPLSAVASGAVDFVAPPDGIAKELARTSHPFGRLARAAAEPELAQTEQAALEKIFQLLRGHCGVDFSYYKAGTINRRIQRRQARRRGQGSPGQERPLVLVANASV